MKKEVNKTHHYFVEGPIEPQFIADSIAKHSTKKTIGAHDIFLGQVRADVIDGKTVSHIDYTAYINMANKIISEIREDMFAQFELTCLHIHHSLGKVEAGKISLFVFVSSPHRKAAFLACAEIVERLKKDIPIWGKEFFEEGNSVWKQTT